MNDKTSSVKVSQSPYDVGPLKTWSHFIISRSSGTGKKFGLSIISVGPLHGSIPTLLKRLILFYFFSSKLFLGPFYRIYF